MQTSNKVQALDALREQRFHLHTSFEDTDFLDINRIEAILSSCVEELIAALGTGASARTLRKILSKHLRLFTPDLVFDTEDRESTAELVQEMADIVKVDLSKAMAIWMYGPILGRVLYFTRRRRR